MMEMNVRVKVLLQKLGQTNQGLGQLNPIDSIRVGDHISQI